MGYEAETILKSVGPNGIVACSMRLRMPRLMLPEFERHRMFSMNVKSSRAKPVDKYIKEVWDDSYTPFFWGRAKKGMQSSAQEIRFPKLADLVWNTCRNVMLLGAWSLSKLGVHKQNANRLVEPFLYTDLIVTATEPYWNNFFALRCGLDGAADPAIQKIARMACRAYRSAPIQKLEADEWHLPYIEQNDVDKVTLEYADMPSINIESDLWIILCKISAARCARLSYYSFETGLHSTVEEDLKLFNKLMGKDPKHSSPSENQLRALKSSEAYEDDLDVYKKGGNCIGWEQFRKTIPNEVQLTFDYWSVDEQPYIIK